MMIITALQRQVGGLMGGVGICSYESVQNPVKRMKVKPQTGRKIFENHTSDKGIVSCICKEFSRLNNKKTAQLKKEQRI